MAEAAFQHVRVTGKNFERSSLASGRVLSHVRLGGLHHRYDRAA